MTHHFHWKNWTIISNCLALIALIAGSITNCPKVVACISIAYNVNMIFVVDADHNLYLDL